MIELIQVSHQDGGNLKAHDILEDIVDRQTLLALSGGTSVDYRKMIVDPGDVIPGAVCLADERYGEPFHKDSNELLLKNSGVVKYCERKGIDFYKILEGKDIERTARDYDRLMLELFTKYPKKVGVMGVGTNLHTAGIFPYSVAAHSPDFVIGDTIDDEFPQRITLTLKALGEFENFVILAFGEEKKEVLTRMLSDSENDMQKYPAIFYRKVPARSWLVTDQKV